MLKTEREAWQAVLETLEMTGEMPPSGPYVYADYKCIGLCDVVRCLYNDRLITMRTRERMWARIRIVVSSPKAYRRNWLLAPAYSVAPRLLFLKQFIKESRAKA